MTKEAMRDAFIAGWNARERYRDGSGTAPLIEFDLYWQPVNETLDRGGPILASGPAPVTPFDFSKLPRPGGNDRRLAVNAEVTANFITGETTYRDIIPGECVGDLAGIEALFDEARADAIEEQEAANFAAFDPDKFVSPDEPAHMRGDDDN